MSSLMLLFLNHPSPTQPSTFSGFRYPEASGKKLLIGANTRGWSGKMSGDELQIAVKRAVVLVIPDVGGMDMPISNELS
ncbi:hypothetical protein F2Q69_00041813 [Brassica cretica]|uniref:Uncharacterized protein n=1 Tax=Brassica cretica TaxID=69181 RepID=A0A8S9NGS7_BRACR|nr:hypothetical protein F2Q69_00041813 [Brassica cretica]